MSLKELAKELAARGRFGDDAILHVSKQELAGLAALAPGGKLSTNPETGAHEAFFFLPFLAGLGAAAAPAAAAAVPAAAAAAAPAIGAGAGALGAGIAAGMSAATSAIPTAAAAALPAATQIAASVPAAANAVGGLGTLTASGTALPAMAELATPLTAGVSTMAPSGASGIAALNAATSAAPALGTVAAPMTPAGGITAATTLPQLGDLAAGLGPAAMPGAGPSFPAAVSPLATPAPAAEGIAAVSEAASPLAGQSFYPPSMATASTGPVEEAAIHAGNAAVGSAAEESAGIGGLLGGMDMNQALMGAAMLSQLMPMGGGGDGEEDSDEGAGDEEYEGGDPVFPGDDYEPGTDDEWDYFPNMRAGGIVHYEGGGGVVGERFRQDRINDFMGAMRKANPDIFVKAGLMPKPAGPAPAPPPVPVPAGSNPVQPPADYQPGIDPEWNYFAKSGGLIGYAQGGLAGLPAGMTPDIMRASLDPLAAAGGGAGLASLVPQQGGAAPQPDPLPKEQTGSNFGDKELISQTVAAIQGQHPDPDKVIREFLATFGEQALADLVARVRGAGVMGDGMSDSVPAMIDGKQPAALSQGEFVVPADVVSGLGNGDTAAGANQLFGMMDRVRTMRNGGPVQPPAISPRTVMPV